MYALRVRTPEPARFFEALVDAAADESPPPALEPADLVEFKENNTDLPCDIGLEQYGQTQHADDEGGQP